MARIPLTRAQAKAILEKRRNKRLELIEAAKPAFSKTRQIEPEVSAYKPHKMSSFTQLPYKHHPVQVMSEWETLDAIIAGKSISRYGDGEMKHMSGRRNVGQVFFESLKMRLIEVFSSRLDNHIVAIPNLWNGRVFTEVSPDYITGTRRKFDKLVDRSYCYGSAYITRGDLCGYLSWPSYWSKMFEVWSDKDVTLVRGHEKRANTNMMKKAKSIHQIEVPMSSAWRDYDKILAECLERPASDLFLLCVGPTATVLAHDLAKRKRHAVDLGHLGLFYRRCWGIEDVEDRQVWHHRPSDPGYIKGVTDQC